MGLGSGPEQPTAPRLRRGRCGRGRQGCRPSSQGLLEARRVTAPERREAERRAGTHPGKAKKHPTVAVTGKVGRLVPCPSDLGPVALRICLVTE